MGVTAPHDVTMTGIVNPDHTLPEATMATAHQDVTLEMVLQDATLAMVTDRLTVISEEVSGGASHRDLMALGLKKFGLSLVITGKKRGL